MGVFDNIRKALTVTPVEDYQIAAAQSSEIKDKFSPGVPINPADGYSRTPRAHDFLTGYNIAARPRRNERVSFQTLQGLVEAYDIAQMAITHRIDSIRSLDWFIEPMEGFDKDAEATIAFAKRVLAKPDHELPFRAWLSKFLWDTLAYDAGTLYRMRNNAGQVIGLKVVDGTTIAPMIDYHGGRPTGDAPAYVQFAQGVPWNWLLDSDIIYVPFRPMPNSPYGKAPLESILLNANTDLRFQNYFLSRFTQGTVPEGFASAPESWGPDQIADFQDAFDALMYGDESKKHQIRWVPGGTNFTWSQENTFQSEFSLFLMRKTAAAFHVTPNDLGFTDTVNLANGETQTEVQFRIGSLPMIQHVQDILTSFLQDDLGLPVTFRFDTGAEKDDRLMTAQIAEIMIRNGVVSPSEVREDVYGLQEPDGVVIPRFITSSQGPIPIGNLFAIAGDTDNEAGMPVEGSPLPTPFTPAEGVIPAQPIVKGEATPGFFATTGANASPLIADPTDDDDDDNSQTDTKTRLKRFEEELKNPNSSENGAGLDQDFVKEEMAAFKRFVKARKRDGRWRDFQFEAVPETQASLLNGEARLSIAGDDASFLAKGWRDSADTVPQHKFDIKIVDHYVPAIRDALLTFSESLDYVAVIEEFNNRVVKDAERDALFAQVMARLGTSGNDADIAAALLSVLSESYVAGSQAATEQTGGIYVSPVIGEYAETVDWNNWKPGYMAGAEKLVDGGMMNLLADANITLRGITDTVANSVGNKIAQGVQLGLSNDSIARMIRDDIGKRWRAEAIAHTESTRGIMTATLDTYGANGIDMYNIVLSTNACVLCEETKAAGPYLSTDSRGMPPIHPFCRCATLPVMDSEVVPTVPSKDVFREAIFDGTDLPSLFNEDTEAVDYYGGSGYRDMNSLLRGEELRMSKSEVKEVKGYIAELSEDLRAQKTKFPLIVHRGMSDYGLGRMTGVEQDWSAGGTFDFSSIVGKTFKEEGFMSTWVQGENLNTVSSFVDNADVIFDIKMPPGTAGAKFPGLSGENEFLLPPGTSMRVENVVKEGEKWRVAMMLTGQDGVNPL